MEYYDLKLKDYLEQMEYLIMESKNEIGLNYQKKG